MRKHRDVKQWRKEVQADIRQRRLAHLVREMGRSHAKLACSVMLERDVVRHAEVDETDRARSLGRGGSGSVSTSRTEQVHKTSLRGVRAFLVTWCGFPFDWLRLRITCFFSRRDSSYDQGRRGRGGMREARGW